MTKKGFQCLLQIKSFKRTIRLHRNINRKETKGVRFFDYFRWILRFFWRIWVIFILFLENPKSQHIFDKHYF